MPRRKRPALSKKQISAYMAKIGSKGGKKSRRTLSKTEAKQMAVKRWNKRNTLT